MRSFILAFALAGALAIPAVAGEEADRLDEMATQWSATAGQTEWIDEPAPAEPILHRTIDTEPHAPIRAGDGWPSLDGWMRGDPTLRHWVIHRFDLNADGWLSASEAMTARTAFYQIADSNRSDRITSEEFVAGWSIVRQELRSFYANDLYGA